MTLIEIDDKDVDNINIPFKLYRINREKHKFVLKTRSLFLLNIYKEFSTKKVHTKVYTGGGTHSYRTIARILAYLEKEGFICSKKVDSLNGGFKRIWWKKQ